MAFLPFAGNFRSVLGKQSYVGASRRLQPSPPIDLFHQLFAKQDKSQNGVPDLFQGVPKC